MFYDNGNVLSHLNALSPRPIPSVLFFAVFSSCLLAMGGCDGELPLIADDLWSVTAHAEHPFVPSVYSITISDDFVWSASEVDYIPFVRSNASQWTPLPTLRLSVDDRRAVFIPEAGAGRTRDDLEAPFLKIVEAMSVDDLSDRERLKLFRGFVEALSSYVKFFDEIHSSGASEELLEALPPPEVWFFLVPVSPDRNVGVDLNDYPMVPRQDAGKKPVSRYDWEQRVPDGDDPCAGKMPIDCAKEKLDELIEKVCAEMMPNPTPPPGEIRRFQDTCDKLNQWKAANKIRTHCNLPRAGGHASGKTDPVSGAVDLSGEWLLTNSCAVMTLIHEFSHVLDQQSGKLAKSASQRELLERAKELQRQMQEKVQELEQQQQAGGDTQAIESELNTISAQLTDVMRQMKNLNGDVGREMLKTECAAYKAERDAAPYLLDLDSEEGKAWLMMNAATALQQLVNTWNRFSTDISQEAVNEFCACLREFKQWSQNQSDSVKAELAKSGFTNQLDRLEQIVCQQ